MKAENAKAEQDALEQTASESEEIEAEAVEVESQEVEEVAEPSSTEGEETETPSWMLSDEQQSEQEEQTFTSHDIAAAKKKLKVKLSEKDEEIQSKDEEIAQLKAQLNGAAPKQEVKAPPTLESVDYDEAKFAQAMQEYTMSQVDARIQTSQKSADLQRQRQLQQQKVDNDVNAHLERVVKLSKDSGIDLDTYQKAELNVRQVIQQSVGGDLNADIIADNLISLIGEGSEKIFYQIGVNQKVRNEFQSKLMEDPNGIKAAMYLGGLKAGLNNTVKNRSTARKPAKSAEGGEGAAASEAAFKRKYQKAKAGQERFNIVKEAVKAGISKETTRSW